MITETEKKAIEEHAKFLRDNLAHLPGNGADVKAVLDYAEPKGIEDLKAAMALTEVINATNTLKGDLGFKTIYSNMGIELSPEQKKEAGVTTPEAGDFDLEKIFSSFGMSPVMAAGIAGLAAHFMGGSKLKWALGAGGGTALLGWLNSEDGKKLVEQVKSAFGEGGKGLAALFSGGAEGIGGILGSIGGALGDLKDNPVLGGLVDKFKENPLTAIALVVAMGMGWNKGNGVFGSMFEMGKYALIALAATWVAEHYLGIGGQQRGHEIADRGADPRLLANQKAAEELQVGS